MNGNLELLKKAINAFENSASEKLSSEKRTQDKIKATIKEKAQILLPITNLFEGLKSYRLVVNHKAKYLPTEIQINLEAQNKKDIDEIQNTINNLSLAHLDPKQKELDETQERFINAINEKAKNNEHRVVAFSYTTADYTELDRAVNSPTKMITVNHPCPIYIYALKNDSRGDVLIRVEKTKCPDAYLLEGYKTIENATVALANFFGKQAVFFINEKDKAKD